MAGGQNPGSTSSPLSSALHSSASKEESLAFYKAQYEQLESELADFQASSRELESELEKDVEEAEKRETKLREKVESLGYEVDEWKNKCKQSKAEANTAQNTLQKEITTLRDSNRSMLMKLRDIEVANDDYETQARHTTSSLEDLESKFNVSIERNVMLEEDIKVNEKEREELRIETQRLRDELSDLRVEAEIRQGKLKHAEEALARSRERPSQTITTDLARPGSRASEISPIDTLSTSPTVATPPAKSVSSMASDMQTPPSPPTSDKASAATLQTPAPKQSRLSVANAMTPKPSHYSAQVSRHSRLPSTTHRSSIVTPANRRTTLGREQPPLPSSTSLHQIRGLIGKMQKLEQRVQNARSKLPAPTTTPPRGSPRPVSALSQAHIPSSVTVRSARKRGSIVAPNTGLTQADTPVEKNTKPVSRLSYGSMMPPTPTPTRDVAAAKVISRPSSRASLSSRQSISNLASIGISHGRPSSRQSISNLGSIGVSAGRPPSRQSTRTPLGHYPTQAESIQRPRSSMGGSHAPSHGHSASVSRLSNYRMDETLNDDEVVTPTPSFRSSTSMGVPVQSGIPMPSKRSSGVGMTFARRISAGPEKTEMGPPKRKKPLIDIGETF